MHTRHIRNTGRSKPVPAAWAPHIAAFLRYLAAKGSPDTTRNTRRQQIERAARALAPLTPETATLDVITDYLASQQWSTETLRGHRNALRSFFAWIGRNRSTRHRPDRSTAHRARRTARAPART